MKLMLEALYRLYQEAFWAWMQQRDQTEHRRNGMDRLVRDIQQAFASGDRESARLLSKQLESDHIATLQALQREFTAAGRMQSATFAYWETFMQGVGTLLRRLRAERVVCSNCISSPFARPFPGVELQTEATTSDICLGI